MRINPELSGYFSYLASRRKNPKYAFNDKSIASRAGKLGAKKRWHSKNGDKGEENTPDTEDTPEKGKEPEVPQWQ